MSDLNKKFTFRLPEELHRRAKALAYTCGMTLQQYIINLIEEDLRIPMKEDCLPPTHWKVVLKEKWKDHPCTEALED